MRPTVLLWAGGISALLFQRRLEMLLFKKTTSSNRLWFFCLVLVLFSVSFAAAQNKVAVIPLFDDQSGSPAPAAPVEKTGQKDFYSTGDDGDLKKGVVWPNPRFKDNGNGTVTDRLTGLLWMKNANCFGSRDWSAAITDCNALADGTCGLTDGSATGDWRLANIKELQSLVHYGVWSPALPDTEGTGKWAEGDPFTGVLSAFYWSSTTNGIYTTDAWLVNFGSGGVFGFEKIGGYYVWCVRGGQ